MHQFADNPFALGGIVAPNRRRHTPMQVPIKYQATDMIERLLDCIDLHQDVNTIRVFVDHPLDATHMPFDGTQALDDGCLVVSHLTLHATPRGGGHSEYSRRT